MKKLNKKWRSISTKKKPKEMKANGCTCNRKQGEPHHLHCELLNESYISHTDRDFGYETDHCDAY